MNAIKKMRFYLNLTQKELAEEIGIHQTHLCNIEKGRMGLSLKNAHLIVKYAKKRKYDLKLEDIINFE